ncbi:spermine oxidase [Brachionus plicatilis]|uniref:Spermine oxidase n=1 Tax=Brachionus plicatilis TaxID=10195 RepID=A0A3M7QL81_BRAPC|nr:spermine oxidase [Brachionus plicatilis]
MKKLSIQTAIIGAGISGIAAANNLLDHDYEDFLIFEAGHRIGGRCHTFTHGEGILELGAQFIHGQVGNPIYQLAAENNLIDECYSQILHDSDQDLDKHNGLKINFEDKEVVQLFLTEQGFDVNQNLIETAYSCLNKSVRRAERHSLGTELEQDEQMGFFFYESYLNFCRNYFNLEDAKIKKSLDALFLWRCKWENVENSCHSVFDLSLRNFSKFVELRGSQIMEPKRGYQSIIDKLIEKNGPKFTSRVNLGQELDKILTCQQNADCEHCLYCEDSAKLVLLFADCVVMCNQVVLTMSLGFLKENIKKLFEPCDVVPREKMEAIGRLGFGTVNKIILEYEKRFWPENLEGINLVWSNMDEENLFDRINHVKFNQAERWSEDICSFEPALGFDNILIGWICGSYHERLGDQEVIDECTELLRKFLNRHDIPRARKVFMSKWKSNRLFKGSYSYYAFGSKPGDIDALAKPIRLETGPMVYFAGEATHAEFYSTVHGAYLSGIRESNKILETL